MIDKLLGLWKTNKILFFILIVPVIIAFIYKVLMAANVAGAKKEIKQAEKKDLELRDEQKNAEAKSELIEKQIKEMEKAIEKVSTTEEGWHKK